jgi:hypothetical protein
MERVAQGARWIDFHRMFERFFYIGDGEEGIDIRI